MYFAEIDQNNNIINIVVAEKAVIDSGILGDKDRWVQYKKNGSVRKNAAFIGGKYDTERDSFIPPKPFPSWVLDEDSMRYKPTKPRPVGGDIYWWNEETKDWDKKTFISDNVRKL